MGTQVQCRGWESQVWSHQSWLDLKRPFSAWVTFADRRHQRQRAEEFLRSGWSVKQVRHWYSQAEEVMACAKDSGRSALQARALKATVAQEIERRIVLSKRMLQHMIRRHLDVAWKRFQNSVKVTIAARAGLRRAMQRMLLRQLAEVFDRFAESVAIMASSRQKVRVVLTRMLSLRLRCAFERFVERVGDARHRQLLMSRGKATLLAPSTDPSQCAGCWPARVDNSAAARGVIPYWRAGHWCCAPQYDESGLALEEHCPHPSRICFSPRYDASDRDHAISPTTIERLEPF